MASSETTLVITSRQTVLLCVVRHKVDGTAALANSNKIEATSNWTSHMGPFALFPHILLLLSFKIPYDTLWFIHILWRKIKPVINEFCLICEKLKITILIIQTIAFHISENGRRNKHTVILMLDFLCRLVYRFPFYCRSRCSSCFWLKSFHPHR